MNKLYLSILSMFFWVGCNPNARPTKLIGMDYRIFENTPAWELAQAVRSEDIAEIKRIIKTGKIDINYQDTVFCNTLLMLTVLNSQYASCKTLLELGADVGIHNCTDGYSAIIDASGWIYQDDESSKFLKLLLQYGASPNDSSIVAKHNDKSVPGRKPLSEACSGNAMQDSPINRVKLLVEHGAHVNEEGGFDALPLVTALTFEHYDVMLYLLENGADYSGVVLDRSRLEPDGKKQYITEALTEQDEDEEVSHSSSKYKQKKKVLAFLKSHGAP
jgi:uncharacterized protein